jgi:ADP-ribose pyrophosphatase YjhB (NUDIX family)
MNKPTDSVRIALFDQTDLNHFLVLAEADDPDNWKLPGGKFDSADETPDAAAERELSEELLTTAEAIGLKQAGELINEDGVSARYIYVGRAMDTTLHPSDEIAGTQWVTEETVPDSPNREHILSAVRLARTALSEE